MKKLLFVINTMGCAGAEFALLELFRHLDSPEYEVSLYVMVNQGELARELPPYVRLLNRRYQYDSVLTPKGRRKLMAQVLRAMVTRGTVFRLLPYLWRNFWRMLRKGEVRLDKLLWRVLADGGERMEETYDLAVAFHEGGSTYYVADHVKARKKAPFLHIDYEKGGYSPMLDGDCYQKIDQIFLVSDEIKGAFLAFHPECESKVEVFHNILNRERIYRLSTLPGGFSDHFDGFRVVTLGRLAKQKALEVSIQAARLLKDAGVPVRWYVLGEGDQRAFLEKTIRSLELEEDFLLPGTVKNPYPYLRQADLYVHASRYEGKSIAIQEAQILGKAILISDCSGNREQVVHGVDGLLCDLTPEAICASMRELLQNEELRERLGQAAAKRPQTDGRELNKLLSLLEPSGGGREDAG